MHQAPALQAAGERGGQDFEKVASYLLKATPASPASWGVRMRVCVRERVHVCKHTQSPPDSCSSESQVTESVVSIRGSSFQTPWREARVA